MVEDPCALVPDAGFRKLQQNSPVPLLVDLGCASLRDAADLTARTLQEFIGLAKSKPGALHYGSGGTETTNHLARYLFSKTAGIEMVHVPYRGIAPAVTDLLAGRSDFILPVPSSLSVSVAAEPDRQKAECSGAAASVCAYAAANALLTPSRFKRRSEIVRGPGHAR